MSCASIVPLPASSAWAKDHRSLAEKGAMAHTIVVVTEGTTPQGWPTSLLMPRPVL